LPDSLSRDVAVWRGFFQSSGRTWGECPFPARFVSMAGTDGVARSMQGAPA